ncbi:hypothetical protein NAEGRDRAFT_82154 [Naegleria gruberi]|uniref:RRM domain-containing protein n=1 Tax=Naegleria gruberi TaxID=5762 RepID=D2W2L0_NAEGR|nr:uncharacterized protein NAEGRDRAFT_82154 [Naegleria gruberi]EFC36633.1 hypothetical protein NAEGRDRAFT_82154 [Naegleria gruberi]|eukprot:XP_002669377.1 hypothetical protein NAEGRDRAFT_82154 [Naegleria gruberi strain NEG-M]
MPRRKTIDDEVDETYEDEYDSQSSDNVSDLVEDEDSTQSSKQSRNEPTQSGPKKRGRKPKNESGVKTTKTKKAPTGRPRGRPRKNPIPPLTVKNDSPTPSSPSGGVGGSGGGENQFDSLLSLGQAALLALTTVSDVKTEDDNSSTVPSSPATPLYPLKKRFLAQSNVTPTLEKETLVVEKVEKPEIKQQAVCSSPAQPVKRRPGRPRKDQQTTPQIIQPSSIHETKESHKDESDAKKMTSRQQILYLKKLEEKRESDSDESTHEKEKNNYNDKEDDISLEFDSDESEEEKKKPKRKVLKKKAYSSPWMKVEKITVKHKGKVIGNFDVSLFGSEESFTLDVGSTIDVGKLSLEKAKDMDYSSFYILSFSSRSKSEEDKLEDLYNTLERDDYVGSVSFDDRVLLLIPKKSRFTKPLGLYEIQDEPNKFIGGLFMKEVPSSPERVSKKKSKSSSSAFISTPKSPILFTSGMDEDLKRNQLSLMSIPKIPKNKQVSSNSGASGDNTPVEDVKPESISLTTTTPISIPPPSSNFTTSHINTPSSSINYPPQIDNRNNAFSNVIRLQNSSTPLQSNQVYTSSMYNMSKNPEVNTGLIVTPNGHYDKPMVEPPQSSYPSTMNSGRYQDTGYSMQDQYHSSNYSHMQQNIPSSYYDNYDNDLKRKRMQNFNDPNRTVSPKRRKSDVPYHSQYSYQQQSHVVDQHSIPSSTSSQPPPPMDMYRSYPPPPSKPQPPPPITTTTPTTSIQPPPPPPPPTNSSATSVVPNSNQTHSYSSRFNQSYTHNSYQQSIPPPRRTDTQNTNNYGYNSKPTYNTPPSKQQQQQYYKNDGDYDNYDRQRSYKKYDDRYQGNGGMNSYSRRTDYMSYDNDYFYRKSHYDNSRRYDSTSSTAIPPPPPPPPETPKDVSIGNDNRTSPNEVDDYNDVGFDEAAEPTRHLWVGRFHNMKMDYSTIYSDFEKFGQIDSLNLLRDQKCAFVNFALVKDAVRAKKELEGTKKYKKIAYQRREKKTSYSSDYKKGMMPSSSSSSYGQQRNDHNNNNNGYHNESSYH